MSLKTLLTFSIVCSLLTPMVSVVAFAQAYSIQTRTGTQTNSQSYLVKHKAKSTVQNTGIPVFSTSAAVSIKGKGYLIEYKGSGTWLDPATLKLINAGRWQEASIRLEPLVDGDISRHSSTSPNCAWLAFAYLYLGKCDQLKKLAERLKDKPCLVATDELRQPPPPWVVHMLVDPLVGERSVRFLDISRVIVEAFNDVCQGKLELAEKALSLPNMVRYSGDCLFNFALATVAGKQGKPQAALAYLQRSVEFAPDFAWGYRTIGFIHLKWLKDEQKGEAAYEQALKIEPHFTEVREALIDAKLSRNDFDGAIDSAKDAIKIAPRDGESYYRLAQIYIQQWRLREGLKELQHAISLEPDNPKYYRSCASIKRFQGNLNEAIIDQQKAVEFSKEKPFEYIELASLNIGAGNNNRAVENLNEALKLDPDNMIAHNQLVKLLKDEKRIGELIEEYHRLLTRKTKDGSLHLGLAKALADSGKPDNAIKEFKEAASLNANDPEPHRQLGALYVKQKEFSAAAREYTRALNINPSSVPDLVALGHCYAEEDEFMQAEAAFVTALALKQLTQPQASAISPDRLDIMRALANLFLKEGRYSDAAAQFQAICVSQKGTNKTDGTSQMLSGLPASMLLVDQFKLSETKALRDRSSVSIQEMINALDKLPDDVRVPLLLEATDVLIKLSKSDTAIPCIDKRLRLLKNQDGDEGAWLVQKARALRLRGEVTKGEEIALKVISMKDQPSPQLSDALLEVAQDRLIAGDLAGASNFAQKAIESYPKSFNAYVIAGRVSLNKQDAKLAIASAKKALELNPYYAQAYMLLGDAQTAFNDFKEASISYRKATELYPALIEAHKSLLSSLKKLQAKDEIKKEEEQIAQLEKQQ